jgi:hypothetical protein
MNAFKIILMLVTVALVVTVFDLNNTQGALAGIVIGLTFPKVVN